MLKFISHTYSDYGFKPADGLNGHCIRDEAVPLDDPCADGQVKTVMKSRGYRKVAGDVCIKGRGPDVEYYEFTCCVNASTATVIKDSKINNAFIAIIAVLGAAIGLLVLTGTFLAM